jgi:hypothetical protein
MPTMADMTIKKNDGSTDVTYTAVVASGGDKSPAIWRNNSEAGYPGQRPELRISSRNNGDNTARRVEGQFTWPAVYTDTATSTVKVLTRANFSFTAIIPGNLPDSHAEEFGAQIGNLIAHSLVEAIITSGYSAA